MKRSESAVQILIISNYPRVTYIDLSHPTLVLVHNPIGLCLNVEIITVFLSLLALVRKLIDAHNAKNDLQPRSLNSRETFGRFGSVSPKVCCNILFFNFVCLNEIIVEFSQTPSETEDKNCLQKEYEGLKNKLRTIENKLKDYPHPQVKLFVQKRLVFFREPNIISLSDHPRISKVLVKCSPCVVLPLGFPCRTALDCVGRR